MAQRVLLHVGTPKSGTTFLQATLWERRAELLAHGVLVPGDHLFDQNRVSIAVRNDLHLPGARGRKARLWRRFRDEAAAHPGTVVLSNEWWLNASRAQAGAAVEQLGGDLVEVVVTTRPLVRLVPAAWQESLKVGRGHALDDFVVGLDDRCEKWSWEALDPSRVARRWAAVVGAERVHLVTAPDRPRHPGELWERFAGTLGLAPDAVEPAAPQANESLAVQAARLMQEYGPALRDEVDAVDSSWHSHSRWLRRAVVREVLTEVPGDPIGVGPRLVADLGARAERAVADLRELGCPVTGDLEELLGAGDRPGARHPDDVTPPELVAVGRDLAVGLLRARLRDTGSLPGGEVTDDPEEPDETGRRDDSVTPPTTDERPPAPVETDRPSGPRVPSSALTRRWTFLVPSAYAAGGIARTVFTTADELVRRGCEVTVITLSRSSAEPALHVDPAVEIIALRERYDADHPDVLRPTARRDPTADAHDRARDRLPSTLATDPHRTFTAHVDDLLEQRLTALEPGVVVSTRPEFAVAASRWVDPRSLLVHQEHLSFLPRPAALRSALRDVALGTGGTRSLDALLTLTDADLERWRDFLGPGAPRTGALPNPTPFEVRDAAPLQRKVVVAAGRMTRQKGFERLIEAWVPLASSHPEWQLRIFGDGQLWQEHRDQVEASGVGDRILLGGVTHELEQELADSSVYAMSSRYEGLPMVLLEALSKGVPPVSFDCPEGPRQLITDGDNGLLVPEGDVPALTAALRRLMDDEELRRRLGARALESARAYQVGTVVDRWVDLVEALATARGEA